MPCSRLAIITPLMNAKSMNKHLKEISAQVARGRAILILDGAGGHQIGANPIVPENITLLPLPPYTPELNPMGNVWEYPRGNKLCALARLGQL